MLLDRKRIKKWGRWIALFVAIVFVGGFLFMGVGYGGAGFDLSALFRGDESPAATPQTPEERLAAYQAVLAQNPTDIEAMMGAANVYQQMGNFPAAAMYLENVVVLDPGRKDIYLRLANLYLHADMSDFRSAVTVLNKATSVDPTNPDVFLMLGMAQNRLGNTEAAILAWQKYLQLAPDGDMAGVVQEQIDELSKRPTTTTSTTVSTSAPTAEEEAPTTTVPAAE